MNCFWFLVLGLAATGARTLLDYDKNHRVYTCGNLSKGNYQCPSDLVCAHWTLDMEDDYHYIGATCI